MHVALFSPAWPAAAHANGIVTYAHWMCQGLRARGHRVSIFSGVVDAPRDDPDVHRVAQTPADRLSQWLRRRVLGRAPSIYDASALIARAMAAVHRREPIDVIDMEESFGWAPDVERRLGVPVVVKLHGPAFFNLGDELAKTDEGKQKIRREGEALARCPVIISPARYTLAATLARYALAPAIVEHVVNPLELGATAPVWSAANAKADRVLFVGRFDNHKGGDLVVRAMQLLLKTRPSLELVFVGPDSGVRQADGTTVHIKEFIAAVGGAELARAISYRGLLARAEIAELRVQAAVTVVASRYENQAYTLLEAMLQGCPVVCTDNTGSSECVEHGVTGLLAQSDDPGDLAAQMGRLLDEPALARSLGAAARVAVQERHAPGIVSERTLDVYRRAIGLKRGAAGVAGDD